MKPAEVTQAYSWQASLPANLLKQDPKGGSVAPVVLCQATQLYFRDVHKLADSHHLRQVKYGLH